MISIIVPIFNSASFIDDCLNSIRSQSFTKFEVIMVDDGSTDHSLQICRDWASKDSRFIVISQNNTGVSAARNRALKEAKGEYICFVDSDDMVAPDYLSHLLELSKDGSFSVCGYCREVKNLCGGRKDIIRYDAKDFIIHILNESIDHPNICMMLFKKSIIQGNNIKFTEGCVRNEDTEFYINYLTYEKTVNVSQYRVYYYRPNPTSAMLAPITIKALTSIEASRRINKLLIEKGIVSDDEIVFSNGLLTYAYSLAKCNNMEIYSYLHDNYDVRKAMVKMVIFPRLSKKLVAIFYLVLGRTLFFHFVGLFRIFRS